MTGGDVRSDLSFTQYWRAFPEPARKCRWVQIPQPRQTTPKGVQMVASPDTSGRTPKLDTWWAAFGSIQKTVKRNRFTGFSVSLLQPSKSCMGRIYPPLQFQLSERFYTSPVAHGKQRQNPPAFIHLPARGLEVLKAKRLGRTPYGRSIGQPDHCFRRSAPSTVAGAAHGGRLSGASDPAPIT